jgi:BirA family biotin operon repressor/biotin-[acetyl-CoA-carboxylase] ligase
LQNNIISGLFIGQNFVTLTEVDSTNSYLKHLLSNSKPLPEGTVIMAENQYAGRGQQQNGWFAGPGKNLTFSILLNPHFLSIANQFDLTRVVSLGVLDALTPLPGPPLKVKWPNDMYYGDKKLGGILIENLIQGEVIKNSVVGIGLNVNQENFPQWVPNAISVKQILHHDYDKIQLLSEICRNLEAWYLTLKDGKTSIVRNAYLSRLYWLNESRPFKTGDEIFNGTIRQVRDNGLLVVENTNGTQKEFSLKEIEFLNK